MVAPLSVTLTHSSHVIDCPVINQTHKHTLMLLNVRNQPPSQPAPIMNILSLFAFTLCSFRFTFPFYSCFKYFCYVRSSYARTCSPRPISIEIFVVEPQGSFYIFALVYPFSLIRTKLVFYKTMQIGSTCTRANFDADQAASRSVFALLSPSQTSNRYITLWMMYGFYFRCFNFRLSVVKRFELFML